MNAFFQILIEKAISLLEAFFRLTSRAHSHQPAAAGEGARRLPARLAHRLSAG